MSVQPLHCPSCGAALQVPANLGQFYCSYCATPLKVERTGAEIALHIADRVAKSIEQTGVQTQATIQEGTYVTQTELRRLQLTQDLSNVQMRLSQIQSEMRAIQRMPTNSVTRAQLKELLSQETALKQQMLTLQQTLNPVPAAQTTVRPTMSSPVQSSQANRFLWMFFSFRGRASIGVYWLGVLVALILFSFAAASAPSTEAQGNAGASAGSCFTTVFSLLSLWVYFAVAVKRFHDRDKSGLWALTILIPLVGVFWHLVALGLSPSTPGPNQYDIEM